MMEPGEELLRTSVDVVELVSERIGILLHCLASREGAVEAQSFLVGLVVVLWCPVAPDSRCVIPWLGAVVVSSGEDVVQSEGHHVVHCRFPALRHHVSHRCHQPAVVGERLLQPFFGDILRGECGVPCQSSEGIPVGLCEVVTAPVGVVADVGYPCHGLDALRLHVVEELLPHRCEVHQVVGSAEILLCDLKLHHRRGVLHRGEERTVWLTRLKVYRTVLYLQDDVVVELSVEGHELLVGLSGPVFALWVVDECPPHHDASVLLQDVGHHVGAFCVGASEITRSWLSFGVGFHKESSEVGYEFVDFRYLLFPPVHHLCVERVGSLQSTEFHGRGEVDGEIHLDAVGPHPFCYLLHLLQVLCRQCLGLGIHIVEHRTVDAYRCVGSRIDFHPLRSGVEEDAPSGESAFHSAVGVVPVVEDAKRVGRLFRDGEVADVLTHLLQSQQVEGAIEQCRVVGSFYHGLSPL